jgi:DNA-binding MarR family transcriptional regulator
MMEPNEIIHQSTRLRVTAALDVLEPDEWLEFTRLRAIVQATDGNLGAHLETLVRAGYVVIEKLFAGRRPQSRVRPTSSGRQAFATHVASARVARRVCAAQQRARRAFVGQMSNPNPVPRRVLITPADLPASNGQNRPQLTLPVDCHG